MRNIIRQIDLYYWLFYQAASQLFGRLSIWYSRRALAHYASAKTERRFSPLRLEDSLYVVMAMDEKTDEPICTGIFSIQSPEQTKRDFEAKTGTTVVFFSSLHQFRKMAVAKLANGDVEHV